MVLPSTVALAAATGGLARSTPRLTRTTPTSMVAILTPPTTTIATTVGPSAV